MRNTLRNGAVALAVAVGAAGAGTLTGTVFSRPAQAQIECPQEMCGGVGCHPTAYLRKCVGIAPGFCETQWCKEH